jgi:hypothetical protein
MDSTVYLSKIFLWLFFLISSSFFLNYLWFKIIPGKIRQIIIFPGVLVHELSHALGCIVTGAKIKEVAIFSPRGSYVSHSKPIIPLVGNFIISFSPIAGSIIALFFLSRFLNFPLPIIKFSFQPFYESFLIVSKETIIFILNNYQSWKFWIFSYIIISLVISLAPSKQDFKNSFLSSLFVVFVLLILSYFGILSEFIFSFLEKTVMGALGIGVFFVVLAIIATLPIYFIKRLI